MLINLKTLSMIGSLLLPVSVHAHHTDTKQHLQVKAEKQHKTKKKLYHQCSVNDSTVNALACAMYFEARSDGLVGMLLVGETIINRTQADEYPDRIKSVIFQPYQFSYNNRRKGEGKLVVRKIYEQESWGTAKALARYLLVQKKVNKKDKDLLKISHGAIMYHKKGERVSWSKDYHKLFTYKSHVFYR